MLQAADLTIRLHPDDDVVIARVELPAGTVLQNEGGVRAAARIPAGHKIAVRALAQGHDQLDLVMDVLGPGWVGKSSVENQGVGGLLEEERHR